MPTAPAAALAEQGRQQLPPRLAAASPIPQRKPKAAPSGQTGTPIMAAPTVGVAAGAAVVLTVGQSTVGSTLRVLGPGSSDRLWPDRTREIAYRFGRHRVLVEGMAVTGVTLWFDPQGVLAAARTLDPAPHLIGNPGSVAVLPATMAGY
ncbi:hypothetical protein M5E06_10800 [Azospirillum sp. A1-3]|uniref:hypothetical protein n=1 Tax=Azospirillum sp. A1-3 TaxID=185874 RepID=UPI00207739D2|nr:hypothetical protein [Azospirillum sp. A1-3]MCM8734680.1 hypothetical protein [Azospirillum sp. A1-3]